MRLCTGAFALPLLVYPGRSLEPDIELSGGNDMFPK